MTDDAPTDGQVAPPCKRPSQNARRHAWSTNTQVPVAALGNGTYRVPHNNEVAMGIQTFPASGRGAAWR
jgi:hypothetical protein